MIYEILNGLYIDVPKNK